MEDPSVLLGHRSVTPHSFQSPGPRWTAASGPEPSSRLDKHWCAQKGAHGPPGWPTSTQHPLNRRGGGAASWAPRVTNGSI